MGTMPLISPPMGMVVGWLCRIWTCAAKMMRRRKNVEGQRSLSAMSHMRLQKVTRPGPRCVCDSSSVELSLLTLPYLKGMLPNMESEVEVPALSMTVRLRSCW